MNCLDGLFIIQVVLSDSLPQRSEVVGRLGVEIRPEMRDFVFTLKYAESTLAKIKIGIMKSASVAIVEDSATTTIKVVATAKSKALTSTTCWNSKPELWCKMVT